MNLILSMLIGLCGMIASLWIAIPGWIEFQEAEASKHWPSVSAKMIVSRLTQEKHCPRADRPCYFVYRPHFTYQYTVNNISYWNSRIDFGSPPDYTDKGLADKRLNEYGVGSKLMVYYDPKNPQNAVMVPGRTYGYIWWQAPLLFFLVSLSFFLNSGGRWKRY
ncbi:MAG: DUF3592 domain-containing protein [Cyanobacteria bacterium]|nr:DUF3592 domain-containing protein [Cyanobacteriota bacterium]